MFRRRGLQALVPLQRAATRQSVVRPLGNCWRCPTTLSPQPPPKPDARAMTCSRSINSGAAVGPGRSSPVIHRDGCERFTPTTAANCAPPMTSARYRTREGANGSSAAALAGFRVVFLAVIAIPRVTQRFRWAQSEIAARVDPSTGSYLVVETCQHQCLGSCQGIGVCRSARPLHAPTAWRPTLPRRASRLASPVSRATMLALEERGQRVYVIWIVQADSHCPSSWRDQSGNLKGES
jgi:hypothetical protein